MEHLTAAAAAKKYGALIPPHVKIVTGRTPPPKSRSSTRSAGSVQPGNEQLGVPDKHELYDPDYENYMRMQRKLTRSQAKKLRKKKSTKKQINK